MAQKRDIKLHMRKGHDLSVEEVNEVMIRKLWPDGTDVEVEVKVEVKTEVEVTSNYKCDYCEKTFETRGAKNRHAYSVHQKLVELISHMKKAKKSHHISTEGATPMMAGKKRKLSSPDGKKAFGQFMNQILYLAREDNLSRAYF